jgi:uncharacterized protein YbaA (DUF1428 family)
MGEAGQGYVQLFVYRVPNKNRDAMQRLLKDIADLVRRHGAMYSEFYRVYSPEAFQGFISILNSFSSSPDEELWIELDHYKGRSERDQAMAGIGKDQSAGPLFKQLRVLVSEGYSIVMAELDSLRM